MPMTLPINSNYHDPDAQTLLEYLPHLQSQLTVQEEDVAFLRRFLRRKEVQATMKSYKSISILSYRKLRPVSMAAVALAANIFCDIRRCNDDSQLSEELMEILSKPSVQALLYTHDVVAKRDYETGSCNTKQERHAEDNNIKVVQLVKKNEPLGVTIQQNDDTGIIEIARILHGGAAHRSGLIHVGDEIHEINGVKFTGRNPDDMANLLARITGPVTLKLVQRQQEPPSKRASNIRVKALFSYDRHEDTLIPCQNAGLSFKRGDILHIVSQEDPLWWQARPEKETEGVTGIIPSQLLQERREILQELMTKKEVKGRRARSVSPCKVSPRISRSKRVKKVMYQAVQNGEFEMGDIPTYEEVELMKPDPDHSRPLILAGVSNVGRNELKQRLMGSDPSHFVDVVPYTSRPPKSYEVQGREYHFVTRREMESAILARRFVEHGEYKGHLYGTRRDSILSIVKSGRVPILTPSAKALRYLRISEIKPFIIYIKPPSINSFRETRLKYNAIFTGEDGSAIPCSEDIILSVVAKSAKLEEIYGHLFDFVIVNDDISRAAQELIKVAENVKRDLQWVPAAWVE
ncbi:MAGUK p55 subfamily member 7-like [Saccostrea echinata]|uniref:MAGUK p55 subfamily member 7-like n=1 Tax=Saccostrea echinata TaxID=191078 RepID=UPI002A82E77E|nr:MAGUK p55 subfamily member 7-like [Saccostrea echinata]XP_061188150.1 MAGUK p55 subfamily member 7-like [Saccostrea echinata]